MIQRGRNTGEMPGIPFAEYGADSRFLHGKPDGSIDVTFLYASAPHVTLQFNILFLLL